MLDIFACWMSVYKVVLRLVFTRHRAKVSIIIRSIEWYNLLKIKLTELKAEHPFYLWLCLFRSSTNLIVRVGSRRGRIKPIIMFDSEPFDWLVFQLLLPTFTWIISNRIINEIRKNWNVLNLSTMISASLWLHLYMTLIFKRVVTQSVETKFVMGTPICKCVTHSLTHSGVDTLRN